MGSSSGQVLSTVLPVSRVSCLGVAPQHCHTQPPARTAANTSMFPADPADTAACPREQPCLSCTHLSPYAGGPVSCLFPSLGCSTQHAGRGSSWDLHTGMQECPRKETQQMGAIAEERRRLVIWARLPLDTLSYRPPLSGQGKETPEFGASCPCSHGRQLLHICYALDRVSPCQTKLSHTFCS